MSGTARALRYIADHTHWLAHHREAEEAFDELEYICTLVDTAIDTHPPKSYAGRCDVCRRDMYAIQDAETVQCAICHIDYPMDERRTHLLDLVADQLETASNISSAVTELGESVTPDMIRKWADQGRLISRGRDLRGRATYRVGDVLDLRKSIPRRQKRTM